MNWQGKKVAMLGWGIDTRDVEPWLKEQGANITILDEKNDGKPFGDLTGFDVLVRNPAVYRYRPELVEAEKKGVVITSKMGIFFDTCPAKIIGVTGTKGKGTTATLIYKILEAAGKKAFLGGNIGTGVFEFIAKLDSNCWVVLELSSFQLIDLHKSPHIAVVLMTTVDHLDWHKDEQEYVTAKGNITKWQSPDDYAVINKDYANSRKIGDSGKGQKIWISGKELEIPPEEIGLWGEHNRENVAAAVAVSKIINIDSEIIKKTVKEFKGLEHRLEEVIKVDGVTYFDDSFSTTPETTVAAIKAFKEPLILICGGSDKGSDFLNLGEAIAKTPNMKAVILIGLMAEKIETAIDKAGGKVPLVRGNKNMAEIIEAAKKIAQTGDVVILSPAAASFDMFKNYKDRGEQFKKAVRGI